MFIIWKGFLLVNVKITKSSLKLCKLFLKENEANHWKAYSFQSLTQEKRVF